MGALRIIFNIFQLTTTEAMSSYKDRFVKTGVDSHALYFENEVGKPPIFLHFWQRLLIIWLLQKYEKNCVVEVFRANVLKFGRWRPGLCRTVISLDKKPCSLNRRWQELSKVPTMKPCTTQRVQSQSRFLSLYPFKVGDSVWSK